MIKGNNDYQKYESVIEDSAKESPTRSPTYYQSGAPASGCVSCGLDLLSPGISKAEIENSPSYQLINKPIKIIDNYNPDEKISGEEDLFADGTLIKLYDELKTLYTYLWIEGHLLTDIFGVDCEYWFNDKDDIIIVLDVIYDNEIYNHLNTHSAFHWNNMEQVLINGKPSIVRKIPIRLHKEATCKIILTYYLPCNVCCENKQHYRRVVRREFNFDYRDFQSFEDFEHFRKYDMGYELIKKNEDLGCTEPCAPGHRKIPDYPKE